MLAKVKLNNNQICNLFMCRMAAIIQKERISEQILNTIWEKMILMGQDKTTIHEHNEGREGQFIHGHGWGCAWINETGKIERYISGNPIWEDNLPEIIKYKILQSKSVIIHVRKASPNLPVAPNYCHPFIKFLESNEQIALAHNGTIMNPEILAYDNNLNLEASESDTEKLLLHYITKITQVENKSNRIEGLKKIIMDSNLEYSGLNLMILFNNEMLLTNNYLQTPKYLGMKYLQTDDLLIVASEKIGEIEGEWKDMENHSIIHIKNNDLDTINFHNTNSVN